MKVSENKRSQYIQNFLENNSSYKKAQTKRRIFEFLQTFAKSNKKSKKIIKRVHQKWTKNLLFTYLNRWKGADFKQKIVVVREGIVQIQQQNLQHQEDIENLNEKIEETLAYNSALGARLLEQAQKCICNTSKRYWSYRLQESFKHWKNTVKSRAEQASALRSLLNHHLRKSKVVALKLWVESTTAKTVQDFQLKILAFKMSQKKARILKTWSLFIQAEKRAVGTVQKFWLKLQLTKELETLYRGEKAFKNLAVEKWRDFTFKCRKEEANKKKITKMTKVLERGILRGSVSTWRTASEVLGLREQREILVRFVRITCFKVLWERI